MKRKALAVVALAAAAVSCGPVVIHAPPPGVPDVRRGPGTATAEEWIVSERWMLEQLEVERDLVDALSRCKEGGDDGPEER